MDAGAGGAAGQDDRPPIPPSTWYGIAVLGVVVFLVGIYTPAWNGVPAGLPLSYLTAALGGALFVAGLTLGERARQKRRPTPIEEIPGVEVFRPSTLGHVSAADTPGGDDRTDGGP